MRYRKRKSRFCAFYENLLVLFDSTLKNIRICTFSGFWLAWMQSYAGTKFGIFSCFEPHNFSATHESSLKLAAQFICSLSTIKCILSFFVFYETFFMVFIMYFMYSIFMYSFMYSC